MWLLLTLMRPLRRPPVSRRARAVTSAALSVCLLAGAVSYAAAEPDPQQQKDRVDKELDDATGDLHDTSQELVDAYEKLKSTRAKLPGARSKAKRAKEAEEKAQGEYDDAVSAHDVAQANERKAEKELRSTSTKITSSRRAVAGFAGQVYQRQGAGTMSVAVGAEDPSDVVDQMIMAESAGESRSSALEELSTSRANLVSTGDRLTALRSKTQRAKKDKETERGRPGPTQPRGARGGPDQPGLDPALGEEEGPEACRRPRGGVGQAAEGARGAGPPGPDPRGRDPQGP